MDGRVRRSLYHHSWAMGQTKQKKKNTAKMTTTTKEVKKFPFLFLSLQGKEHCMILLTCLNFGQIPETGSFSGRQINESLTIVSLIP